MNPQKLQYHASHAYQAGQLTQYKASLEAKLMIKDKSLLTLIDEFKKPWYDSKKVKKYKLGALWNCQVGNPKKIKKENT